MKFIYLFLLIPTFFFFSISANAEQSKLPPLILPDITAKTVTLFSIHGSNTIGAKLAPALVSDYLKAKGLDNVRIKPLQKENEVSVTGDLLHLGKSVQIVIAAHGSSTGFKGLQAGRAQIAAASRPVKQQEVENLASIANLQAVENEHVLAIDGLAIVVHPQNPVKRLNKKQLGKIFSGEISDWAELGGHQEKINLYARDQHSGTWDTFKRLVLGKEYKLHESAKRFESNDRLSRLITQDKQGLGFVGLASVGKAKLLSVSEAAGTALKPNRMTVATEDYVLSRRLYLYQLEQDNKWVNEFIAFSQGYRGQEIVAQTGFVSQNIVALEPVLDQQAPDDYVDLVKGAKRLSINFRFKPGSARLDSKAQKDIERLVDYLDDHKVEPELLLVGFGDKRKSSTRTRLISKLRAMAVRRELVRNAVYPDETTGYGEFLPVASMQSLKNRRVEVWLR